MILDLSGRKKRRRGSGCGFEGRRFGGVHGGGGLDAAWGEGSVTWEGGSELRKGKEEENESRVEKKKRERGIIIFWSVS